MEATLITFEDLHERTELDIIGGIVEVPTLDKIFRGTIDDILWWRCRHPRTIEWTDGTVWNARFGVWDRHGNGRINFGFEETEYFGGPYEMKTREIFFISRKLLYVIIFPAGCEPPEVPYDWQACFDLHCRIMGYHAPKRSLT